MKVREFDILNYKIVQRIMDLAGEKLKRENQVIFGRTDIDIFVTFHNVNQWINDKKTLKQFFNRLDKDVQQDLIKYFKKVYEENKKETIKNYEIVKKKTDFIFFDDKEYKKLCDTFKDVFYCQATTILIDFMNKKLKSKALKNIKYSIRNQEYSNITCD